MVSIFLHGRMRWLLAIAIAGVGLAVTALVTLAFTASDRGLVLWHIVHDRCLPHWEHARDPAPCAEIDDSEGAARGTVILKDRNGVAQYLVIPTRQISGIESPELRDQKAPNLFAAAWHARVFLFKKLGRDLPRDGVGLAINSAQARSQEQAHVHVDCLRADVQKKIRNQLPAVAGWEAQPFWIDGTSYRLMRIDAPDLSHINPFQLVWRDLPQAKDNMANATMVLVGETFPDKISGFLLFVGFADIARGAIGHGEDLLDHSCSAAKVAAAAQ